MTSSVDGMTGCASCGKVLIPVISGEETTATYQFEDALWVGLFGGYGMFVDEMMDWPVGDPVRVLPGRPDFEAVLCGECAMSLVEANPWLARMLSAPQ